MCYLGVIFEQSLGWSLHISNIVKKISRNIACIRRISSCLTRRNLNQLYSSLILSHIDYCNTVWGTCTKSNLIKLQRCQNRYARLVLNADFYTPKHELMNRLGWQDVEQRIKFKYAVETYKTLNGMNPRYMNNLISNRFTHYRTRFASNCPLFIPKPKTDFKKRSFSYVAPSIFNKIPPSVQSATSLTIFKRLIRLLSVI